MSNTEQPPIDYGMRWEKIIPRNGKSFVCFAHGTCVVFRERQENLRGAAEALLKKWGRVQPGSPSADYSTIRVDHFPGWVITCHHQDILTLVDPAEGNFEDESELVIGLHGRAKRDLDATELSIVHIREFSQ